MAGTLSCIVFQSFSTFVPRDGWRFHFLAQPFSRFPLSCLAFSLSCTAFQSFSTFVPRDGWRSHFLAQPFSRFPLSCLMMAGALTLSCAASQPLSTFKPPMVGALTLSCTAFHSLSTFVPHDGWRSHFLQTDYKIFELQSLLVHFPQLKFRKHPPVKPANYQTRSFLRHHPRRSLP